MICPCVQCAARALCPDCARPLIRLGGSYARPGDWFALCMNDDCPQNAYLREKDERGKENALAALAISLVVCFIVACLGALFR